MSYEELRSSIRIDGERPLKATGKIYVYGDYLLISEPNEGIHFYDNSDPSIPLHLGFIVVPGNQDMAINQGLLYVDSYIDLVTIDLRDIDDIREIHRVEEAFRHDPYRVFGEEYFHFSEPVDEERGVVVGYEVIEEGEEQ